MYRNLKKYLEKLGIKGRVRNHSSKALWVIENTSPNGPTAHMLKPKMKSPKKIDADGFKRFDGKAIDKHSAWWKITNVSTADIFDSGTGLDLAVIYRKAVSETHFGKPKYIKNEIWGERINYIVGVKRTKSGSIEKYFVSSIGWVSKSKAVKLAKSGDIDLVVLVEPSNGAPYLRSLPGRPNFGDMS